MIKTILILNFLSFGAYAKYEKILNKSNKVESETRVEKTKVQYPEYWEARVELKKAMAELSKVDDEYEKVMARYPEYHKARNEVKKAQREWHKVEFEMSKVKAEYWKAQVKILSYSNLDTWSMAWNKSLKLEVRIKEAEAEYNEAVDKHEKATDKLEKIRESLQKKYPEVNKVWINFVKKNNKSNIAVDKLQKAQIDYPKVNEVLGK